MSCCARPSSASADRVREELAKTTSTFDQLTFDFAEEDRRQLEAEHALVGAPARAVRARPRHEPDRIASFYEVRARRVEPVGLVYLWPETN